jgi:hypothetical protein
MNTNSVKKKFVLLLSLFFVINVNAQDQYCKEYERDCRKAKIFFTENKSRLESVAKASEFSAEFLFAIVAPEITQFSYLSDKIETYSLKILYVQNGKGYSDFSIGIFQMKPSFIENLENYIISNTTLKGNYEKFLFENPTERQARVERVERLGSTEWQMEYLSLFCEVVKHKFSDMIFADEEERLRFYASAYNSGFHKTEQRIKDAEKSAFFPHFSRQKHRYSDIAVWFYRELEQTTRYDKQQYKERKAGVPLAAGQESASILLLI